MYFDTFNAILPWQNANELGGHYTRHNAHLKIVGNIGIQVLQLMMSNILT